MPEASVKWLLLLHQLPASATSERVKVWRRLTAAGAAPLRRSVHVLSRSADALESLEWIRSEIEGLGGQATIVAAAPVDPVTDLTIDRQVKMRAPSRPAAARQGSAAS